MKIMDGKSVPPLLVVTDLDGTLLDHHDYSPEPAMPMLRLLQELHIPVIFNTSKTSAECQALSERLAMSNPFIVENGSAIYVPKRVMPSAPPGFVSHGASWVHIAGLPYTDIIRRLQPLKSRYRFANLNSTAVEEIMAATGLNLADAHRATARQFSEPLIWQDTEAALSSFRAEVTSNGLNLLQGGRYLHVLGDTDKGRAMQTLKEIYTHQRSNGQAPRTLALGDSQNDIAMLQAADMAAFIRSPVNDLPDTASVPRAMISEQTGPAGWAECVKQVLINQGIIQPSEE